MLIGRRGLLAGSLGAAAVWLVGRPGWALPKSEISLVCPVDGTAFKAFDTPLPPDLFAAAAGAQPPRSERDLRPPRPRIPDTPTQTDSAREALWRCPGCHYAAWRSDFAGPLDEAQKARLKAELKPAAAPGDPPWVSFDLAARAYAIRGAPHRRRALALCYAVYDMADGASTGSQDRGLLLKRFRWSAREAIRLGVAKREFSPKEMCLARYVLAEMTRRGGHFSDSIDDFKKAAGTRPCAEWLAGWIEQQAAKAKVGIAGDQ